YNVAIGIGEAKKWALGIDFTRQQFTNYSNRFKDIVSGGFENANRIAVGGYYIPNYNSFTSYTKRIVYRAGLRYEKTGLIVDSEAINDIGFTLGLGMPITGSFSNVNFGFELGKKGTTTSNLVQENYANFSLSLSLNDKWFEKRKFN
ncbi:MAG: hypothetical protein RLZZ479_1579, partial [Bacteroidota bacterium]